MNLCRPRAARKRGQAGWRRPRISYVAEERTGYCSRRHRGFRKTPTLYVQARSMEALPCTERTSMAWPRRGYRDLYRYGESFPNQGLWGQAAALVGPGDHGATNPCVARPVSKITGTPDPGRYSEYRNGLGVRHRASEKPSGCKTRSRRSCATTHP